MDKNLEKEMAELEKELDDIDIDEVSDVNEDDLNALDDIEVEDNMSVGDLEREINEMDDLGGEIHQKPKLISEFKIPENVKVSLVHVEEHFHAINFIFGNAMKFELEKIIPALKKKYEKNEKALDLMFFISQKEGKILKMKMGLEKKAQAGQMDPKQYVVMLGKIQVKNEKLLEVAQEMELDPFDIGRIKKRIEIAKEEINKINGYLMDEEKEKKMKEEVVIETGKEIIKSKNENEKK